MRTRQKNDIINREGGNTMPKIAIVTDSNSGILQLDAQKLGIYVVPMPFTINKKD